MGRTTLLAVAGFTLVITYMLIAANAQKIGLTQKTSQYYTEIFANSIAASGARIALSHLSQDINWRVGIPASGLNGGVLTVTVSDVGADIQISSQGAYSGQQKSIEVLTSAGIEIKDLAIFTTGTVTNVATLDVFGNPDPSLLKANQSRPANVNHQTLVSLASTQSQLQSGASFTPSDGYPNGSFYHIATTPNVTHVLGDLIVNGGTTVYGIFVVEGDIILHGSAQVEGVLYLENSTHSITYGGSSPGTSFVTGGIVANGNINGGGNQISVQYGADYMLRFVQDGQVKGGKVTIKSWKELADGGVVTQ